MWIFWLALIGIFVGGFLTGFIIGRIERSVNIREDEQEERRERLLQSNRERHSENIYEMACELING